MFEQINVKVVPQEDQDYETLGNWWYTPVEDILSPRTLEIRISDTGNPVNSMLLAIHELVEAVLCYTSGIDQDRVTDFDILYEEARINLHETNSTGIAGICLKDAFGGHDPITEDSEPGDDTYAPYQVQHQAATLVEQFVCERMGRRWMAYNDSLLD
ncbi:MAG: hypothetical protein ACREQ5_16025 [Candidatus Dormibacteria bacterium]